MRTLSHLLSLVLLTLWLPVTQHCNLEAIGLIALECPDGCTAGAGESKDSCADLETGLYKVTGDLLKAPAPDLLACDLFLRVDPVDWVTRPEPMLLPAEPSRERPLDWVTTWNFVRRTAPPSRAPSLRCA